MNQETLNVVEKIANRLAPKYTFGHYDIEDIKQEIYIIAMEGVKEYNKKRGAMSTFLYYYINSRIKNFKRDNYFRQEYKCSVCESKDPYCDNCIKRQWKMRRKSGLLEPSDISVVEEDSSIVVTNDLLEDLAIQELKDIIDRELPVSFREDYLRMTEGLYVHKSKRSKIEEIVYRIIDEWQSNKKSTSR